MGDFEDLVASVPAREGPFRPFAMYDRVGDQIEVYLSDENSYGKPIVPGLVALIGERDGNVVGLIVEGVSRLMEANGPAS